MEEDPAHLSRIPHHDPLSLFTVMLPRMLLGWLLGFCPTLTLFTKNFSDMEFFFFP